MDKPFLSNRQKPGKKITSKGQLRFNKDWLKSRTARIFVHVALLTWLSISVYPFLWVLTSSLKSVDEYFRNPLALPTDPQWLHYQYAWTHMRFQEYFLNSTFVSIFSLIGSLTLSASIAFVMFSFLLPGTTALYPMVVLAQKIGLYGSLWALVFVYSAQSVPWNAFFLRSAMEGIPRELEDAAIIDGASTWQVFWWVMLPLARPALATMGIFSFLYTWGDFALPIMLAKSDELFTVAVGTLFLTISGKGTTDPTLVAAGLLISIIPVVLIYIFLQRFVIEGLTSGAVKGIG
jgi:raffinose/stachyose/melibiose transport system permease protein